MTQNTDYSALANQVNEAFKAYRETYSQTNPPPDLQKVARKHAQNNRLIYRVLGALVASSMVVSGSHTVPVFADSLPEATPVLIKLMVSVAAFIAIEVAILVYAYQRVEKAHANNPNMSKDVQRLMGYGLVLAIAVALGANVYSVLKPHMTEGGLKQVWDMVSIVVAVLVGISAPVLAFIAGELFGLLTVEARERKATILTEFDQQTEDWESALRDAWARDRIKWGARVSVERPSAIQQIPADKFTPIHSLHSVNEAVNERDVNTANGYTKQMNAREVIKAFFEANPDAIDLNLDVLVTRITSEMGVKIGRTSIHNVRRDLKNEQSEGK